MKKSLLATVAAVALIAGTGFAVAEGAAKEQSGMNAGGGAQMKGDAKGGAQMKGQAQTNGAGSADSKAEGKADMNAGADTKADTKGDTKGDTKAKADTKSKADTKAKADTKDGAKSKAQTTGQSSQPGQMERSSPQRSQQGAQGQPERSKQGSQDRQGQERSNQQSNTAGNAGGSVNLTSEQKTKVRTTVLQSRSAPKVSRTNINFSINVGTVVPRSVKVVAVPTTLIEIHPAWRGYSYFIVDEEIIIVEPRTLRIIAVITV